MAKFYGKSSAYLFRNDLKYDVLAASFPVIVLFAIIAIIFFFHGSGALTLIILFVLLVVLVRIFEPVALTWHKISRQYFRGYYGEAVVAKILKELPDAYSIFEDVRIGLNKGNIDFVVVGPPGVFVIEVKSHGGKVDFDGAQLTLNGRPFREHKDFFREVHGETWALKEYLQQQLGFAPYIHSVLVFSHQYASMSFGYTPIKNIFVLQKDFLPGLFHQFKLPPYKLPQERITTALTKTVKRR